MTVRIDITGNVGQDVELKYGQDGTARARLRVAATPRRKNQQSQAWEDDGLPQWYSVTLFGAAAESLAAAAGKGSRVRATGVLVHRSWQGQNGVENVDHEIKYADVTLYPPKSSQNQGQGTPGGQFGTPGGGGAFGSAQNDPWASSSFNDAPPF